MTRPILLLGRCGLSVGGLSLGGLSFGSFEVGLVGTGNVARPHRAVNTELGRPVPKPGPPADRLAHEDSLGELPADDSPIRGPGWPTAVLIHVPGQPLQTLRCRLLIPILRHQISDTGLTTW